MGHGVTCQHISWFAWLYILLAQFVLEKNYADCDGLPDAYLPKISTEMGTSFSATDATIFMIWLETPIMIIEEFCGYTSDELVLLISRVVPISGQT